MAGRSRQPYDSKYAAKRKKDGSTVYHGGPPRRATGGVIRQLKKLKRQNPAEYERQLSDLPHAEQAKVRKAVSK